MTDGAAVGLPAGAVLPVTVELPHELDVADWAQRHDRGLVPDRAPYGLDKLADHGVAPRFRTPVRAPATRWWAGKVRNHAHGTELVGVLGGTLDPARRSSAAVLCMDERTGLPAALVPGGPPVAGGIAWIEAPEQLHPAYRALVRRALPRMGAVWTNVSAMAPVLQRAWGLRPDAVHVVPLGIDADFFPAQPWPDRPGLVVSAGEDRMRDHDVLVSAVAATRRVVGDAHLELASSLPVSAGPDVVTVHRRRMDGEMRGLYRRSTVVAVALHPNPLGSGLTVVLEAMASARAIVVTANPGLEDYVEHGVTGLLVPAGDPEAFACALQELLQDPDRAREMGERGRAALLERWTTGHMAGHLADVLRAVA